MRLRKLGFLAILSFFVLVERVLAEEQKQVDLTQIPYYLGVQLNVGTFAGGIIASGILLLVIILPILIITRGKGLFAQIAIIFIIMGAEIAIGWLPFWFLVMLVVLSVGLFSKRIVDAVAG